LGFAFLPFYSSTSNEITFFFPEQSISMAARASSLQYGPMSIEDRSAVDRNDRLAFSMSEQEIAYWRRHCGDENCRVVKDGSTVLGSLVHIPHGLFVGPGSSPIRTLGLASVCVLPEARGRGVGNVLLRSMLAEAYEKGYPLSMLYPTTWPFYRAVGYDAAGQRFKTTVPLGTIETREKHSDSLVIQPFDSYVFSFFGR
jgi:predicted N-acetyltransferase YhbS